MAKVAVTGEKYKVEEEDGGGGGGDGGDGGDGGGDDGGAAAAEDAPLLGGDGDDLDLAELEKAEWDIGTKLEKTKAARLDTMEEVEKHFEDQHDQWRRRLLAPALLVNLPFFPAFLALLVIFFGNIVYHVTHEKDTGQSSRCSISRLTLGVSIWIAYVFMFAYGWILFQPRRVEKLKHVMWTWIAIYAAVSVNFGVIGTIAVGKEWGCPDSTRNFHLRKAMACKPDQSPLGNYCYDSTQTPGRYNPEYIGRTWRGTSLYAFVTFEVVMYWLMTANLIGFLVMYKRRQKKVHDDLKSQRTKAVNAIIAAKNAAEAAEREAKEKAEREAREKKEAAAARKSAWEKEEADKKAAVEAARKAKYGDSDDDEDDDSDESD